MKTRARWFSCPQLEKGAISKIAKAAQLDEFSAKSESGFRIEKVRPEFLHGTFIQVIKVKDTIKNPFGESIVQERIEYRQTVFRLFARSTQIELVNAPRSFTALFDQLTTYLDSTLTITAAESNCLKWLAAIESALGRVKVLEMRLSGIALSASVGAETSLYGQDDVRKFVKEVAGGKKFDVAALAFALQISKVFCLGMQKLRFMRISIGSMLTCFVRR